MGADGLSGFVGTGVGAVGLLNLVLSWTLVWWCLLVVWSWGFCWNALMDVEC